MKLSDVKGERTFDVIAGLIEPVSNIAADPNTAELFKKTKKPEELTKNQFLLHRAKKFAPNLLKEHKQDVITILSLIKGIEYDEYLKQVNLVTLLNDLIELLTDEMFETVFTSSSSNEKKTSS